MRILAPLALVLITAVTGCATVPTLEHGPTPTPQLSDRNDCGEILGSAFRSSDERAWFTDNCSAWADTTLGEVKLETSSQSSQSARGNDDGDSSDEDDNRSNSNRDDDDVRDRSDRDRDDEDEDDPNAERCDQLRGRPYESRSQRSWFLENCLQQEVVPGEPSECAEIRGRPYESRSQRAWFLENCTASGEATSPGVARDPGDGPDRHDCNQIRGTQYRSSAERRWFLQNCT
jgi:hypothetical protein